MLFSGGCSSWKLPQSYVYAGSHGGHPALDLSISHSRTCETVTLHGWLMPIEEFGLLSLDGSCRSHRLTSPAHDSVSAEHVELRVRNECADEWACIASIVFVQRHLG